MKDIEYIKGIGPKNKKLLNSLGIKTLKDLLTYYPFRYDVIKRSNYEELNNIDKITIDGIVESLPNVFYIKKNLNKMSFNLNIGNYKLQVVIFNRAFLKTKINIGDTITVIGKIDKIHNIISANDILFSSITETRIEGVYHNNYKTNSSQIHKYIESALKEDYNIKDYLPSNIINKYKFVEKNNAIKEIHIPSNIENLTKASQRIKYEELFLFMLKMNYLKNDKKNKIGLNRIVDYNKIELFIRTLDFELTNDQIASTKNIYNDLISKKRMNRLLQGDVGSGKTIVAFIATYINYLSGYQTAFMAPTEILAKQHYDNAKKLFNFNILLLTGSMKAKEKKEAYEKIKNNEYDLIIGTHALFSDGVIYSNLGLVITDEQHRFGVNQRSNLNSKGITPDTLYLSATPIPRTYALTLYGDMDISNIRTIPKGKKNIITYVKKNSEIKDVLTMMLNELKLKHQIYVVSPLIEESDKVDMENIESLKEKMSKAFSKFYNIGIMHGKMSSDDKDKVMRDFINKDIDILISTTVIEVGVDVKNATMIVIFGAYKYGLSTLHQLRGRVGRNDVQSYCVLVSNSKTERLSILEKTNDGFEISEEDFKLRGYGDLFGIKQSGDMVFDLADIKKDFNILKRANEDSSEYINSKEFDKNIRLKNYIKSCIEVE